MRASLLLLALLAVACTGACGGSEPTPGVGIPASLEVVETEPSALTTVLSEPVVGRTGPGGAPFEVALRTVGGASHLQRRIGSRTFDLALRTDPALTQYPCSSCHQGRIVTPARDPDVHDNVQPVHPAGAACATCHAASAVDRLALEGGETVSFDHAYQQCSRCHFSEVDAWAAGNHGKRLDGWRGRRVVMGCADCHDPHRPAPATRTPFPGPTLPNREAIFAAPPGSVEEAPSERFPLPPAAGRNP